MGIFPHSCYLETGSFALRTLGIGYGVSRAIGELRHSCTIKVQATYLTISTRKASFNFKTSGWVCYRYRTVWGIFTYYPSSLRRCCPRYKSRKKLVPYFVGSFTETYPIQPLAPAASTSALTLRTCVK